MQKQILEDGFYAGVKIQNHSYDRYQSLLSFTFLRGDAEPSF